MRQPTQYVPDVARHHDVLLISALRPHTRGRRAEFLPSDGDPGGLDVSVWISSTNAILSGTRSIVCERTFRYQENLHVEASPLTQVVPEEVACVARASASPAQPRGVADVGLHEQLGARGVWRSRSVSVNHSYAVA